MAEVFEVIERIQYIAEDKGLKEAGIEIQKNADALIDLALQKERLSKTLEATDKKDVENQKRLHTELKQVNEQIKTKSKFINDQAINNRKLNDEIKKEIGLLENVRRRLDAIQVAKGFATTEKELAKLNKQLAQTQRELDKLDGKAKSGGGGFFQSILTGVGVGGGMELFQRGLNLISTGIHDSMEEFKDAEKTALSLQRALKNTGNLQMFDGLVREADKFSEVFKTIDNDDIIKVQTQLINYGKVTRNELSKLTPVVLELARAEGIDFTQATETVINILEGRGGATLRQYGVSVKGVKSEHERLNIVLGQFYDKVKNSNAAYELTLEGQQELLDKNLKEVEEKFGASFAKVKMKVLPILSSILEGLNYVLETSQDRIERFSKLGVSSFADSVRDKSKKELDSLMSDLDASLINQSVVVDQIEKKLFNIQSKGLFSMFWKGEFDKLQENLDKAKGIRENIRNQITIIDEELKARKTGERDKRFNNNPLEGLEPASVTENKVRNTINTAKNAAKNNPVVVPVKFEPQSEPIPKDAPKIPKSPIEVMQEAGDEINNRLGDTGVIPGTDQLSDADAADLQDSLDRREKIIVTSEDELKKKRVAIAQSYISSLGQLADTGFNFILDSIANKIDKITNQMDTAQSQLTMAEKIADRGNADLYNKQVERVQKLEAEREKARNNELEYTQIQNAVSSALAFTQALLVVTNAGAKGDPYTIAARIAAAVAALGSAFAFAQSFKQAKHGLDDSREGERGADRLSLPSPNGEDYFGKLYHLANGEAVIQNWDGTADKYRPAIKAMRRGTLPEWINDLAMGKPLPLINNKAIQDAVVVIQQESNGDMKAMQEIMKDLLFMIGNMELNSTVLSDNGMFNNYRTKLANLNRRKKA